MRRLTRTVVLLAAVLAAGWLAAGCGAASSISGAIRSAAPSVTLPTLPSNNTSPTVPPTTEVPTTVPPTTVPPTTAAPTTPPSIAPTPTSSTSSSLVWLWVLLAAIVIIGVIVAVIVARRSGRQSTIAGAAGIEGVVPAGIQNDDVHTRLPVLHPSQDRGYLEGPRLQIVFVLAREVCGDDVILAVHLDAVRSRIEQGHASGAQAIGELADSFIQSPEVGVNGFDHFELQTSQGRSHRSGVTDRIRERIELSVCPVADHQSHAFRRWRIELQHAARRASLRKPTDRCRGQQRDSSQSPHLPCCFRTSLSQWRGVSAGPATTI